MDMAKTIIENIHHLMPYGFPPDYLKEKIQETLPRLPVFRVNNLYFTLEVRSGNFYIEYMFGENASIRDIAKAYAFIGALAQRLGFNYAFGDATPKRMKAYRKILAAEPTPAWKLPVFVSPVKYVKGDARKRIEAPLGSARLDIFRAFYVVSFEEVDIRSISKEAITEMGEWVINFVHDVGSAVFFGNALTIIELAKLLRKVGIHIGGEQMEEHYILTFSPKKLWDIPLTRKYIRDEKIFKEATMVIGGKEYELQQCVNPLL